MKKRDRIAKADFGAEVAKMHPLIAREFAKRQKDIFLKSSLTFPNLIILDLLVEKGPCKMSELAKNLNFTMSAVTVIVDKMIELGLVRRERSSKDRRVVNIIILNKGKEIARRLKEGRQGLANQLFSGLTREDKNNYIRILRKVYDNLRRGQ